MRAISLDTPQNMEEENELNDLKTRLEFTNNLVLNLGKQIDQLKSTVSLSALASLSNFLLTLARLLRLDAQKEGLIWRQLWLHSHRRVSARMKPAPA